MALANSSMYDAYWSVVPPVIGLYWASALPDSEAVPARQALVLLLVFAWGARLTWNWARGWPGLHHEDWRYRELRENANAPYWLVSLTGIHYFPTLQVFVACLPLYPALALGSRPLGALDALAALVTAGADRARDDRRRAAARVQPNEGARRHLHARPLGVDAPSELPRRDPVLVGPVAVRRSPPRPPGTGARSGRSRSPRCSCSRAFPCSIAATSRAGRATRRVMKSVPALVPRRPRQELGERSCGRIRMLPKNGNTETNHMHTSRALLFATLAVTSLSFGCQLISASITSPSDSISGTGHAISGSSESISDAVSVSSGSEPASDKATYERDLRAVHGDLREVRRRAFDVRCRARRASRRATGSRTGSRTATPRTRSARASRTRSRMPRRRRRSARASA